MKKDFVREEYEAPKCFALSFQSEEDVNIGFVPSITRNGDFEVGEDVEQEDLY